MRCQRFYRSPHWRQSSYQFCSAGERDGEYKCWYNLCRFKWGGSLYVFDMGGREWGLSVSDLMSRMLYHIPDTEQLYWNNHVLATQFKPGEHQ